MARRGFETRIFLPWDRRRGLLRWLGLGHTRLFLLGGAAIAVVYWVGTREHRQAGIRQTRATLVDMRSAIDDYMAKHEGSCPPNLTAVAKHRQLERAPEDAWGRPLRLICPGRHDDRGYELMSDGPDGLPGGLDRIE